MLHAEFKEVATALSICKKLGQRILKNLHPSEATVHIQPRQTGMNMDGLDKREQQLLFRSLAVCYRGLLTYLDPFNIGQYAHPVDEPESLIMYEEVKRPGGLLDQLSRVETGEEYCALLKGSDLYHHLPFMRSVLAARAYWNQEETALKYLQGLDAFLRSDSNAELKVYLAYLNALSRASVDALDNAKLYYQLDLRLDDLGYEKPKKTKELEKLEKEQISILDELGAKKDECNETDRKYWDIAGDLESVVEDNVEAKALEERIQQLTEDIRNLTKEKRRLDTLIYPLKEVEKQKEIDFIDDKRRQVLEIIHELKTNGTISFDPVKDISHPAGFKQSLVIEISANKKDADALCERLLSIFPVARQESMLQRSRYLGFAMINGVNGREIEKYSYVPGVLEACVDPSARNHQHIPSKLFKRRV